MKQKKKGGFESALTGWGIIKADEEKIRAGENF